jgi:hypothetical protein
MALVVVRNNRRGNGEHGAEQRYVVIKSKGSP